jgi:hypothetical protein
LERRTIAAAACALEACIPLQSADSAEAAVDPSEILLGSDIPLDILPRTEEAVGVVLRCTHIPWEEEERPIAAAAEAEEERCIAVDGVLDLVRDTSSRT